MGWYGNYDSSKEVIEEKKYYAKNAEIIAEKSTSKWGAILYKIKESYEIEFFIFEQGCYKPLSWADRPNLIPKAWINKVLPSASDYDKTLYKEYLTYSKEIKGRKKELDSLLTPNKKYLIWGKHEAIYKFKKKNSHVFDFNGTLTRFRKLELEDVKEIPTLGEGG